MTRVEQELNGIVVFFVAAAALALSFGHIIDRADRLNAAQEAAP